MSQPIALGDWPQLLTLVDKALQVPAVERETWLRDLHLPLAIDVALRGLLDERRGIETDDFLQALPQLSGGGPLAADSRRLAPGAMIGPWRLIRELGQGGMSVVWLAERADGQLERQVALKLPHAGPGQDLLAQRMLREREILAKLEHPFIACLYDVGVTTGGTPYLVMEFVQGDNILAYADERRLSIAQRVELFQQVLQAVQYAHSQLVLHRDLKPGNIMVSPNGKAKLLDFGIAKLLIEQEGMPCGTEHTRQGERRLTPSHASPEQLRGQALGTASDVYSLGVILCELLCGQHPHAPAGSSLAQLQTSVLNNAPCLPSRCTTDAAIADARGLSSAKALAKALRGDLDAIAAKALSRMPERRYASADAFGADLARWQRGEPVTARSIGARYYAVKFANRHRVGVGVGSIAALAIVAAGAFAVVQASNAQREAVRTSTARDFLLDLFAEAAPDRLGGVALTATQLLEQGRRKAHDRLDGQPRLQAELLAGIGATQLETGDMIGAEAALTKSASLFQLTGDKVQEASARLHRLGVALSEFRVEAAGEQLASLQSLMPTIKTHRLLHLRWMRAQGQHLHLAEQIDAAYEALSRCVELADVNDHEQGAIAFEARQWLADLSAKKGNLADADRHLGAALAISTRGKHFTTADAAYGLAETRAYVDFTFSRLADLLSWLPNSIAQCDKAFGRLSPRCVQLKALRIKSMLLTGDVDSAAGHAADLGHLLDRSPSNFLQFATAHLLTRVLANSAAVNVSSPPIEVLESLVLPDSPKPLPPNDLVEALTQLTEVRLRVGDIEKADELQRQVDAVVGIATSLSSSARRRSDMDRGLILQARGHHVQAIAAMGQLCKVGQSHVKDVLLSLNCVRSFVRSGKKAQALQLLQEAMPVLTRSLGADAPNTKRAQRLLDELTESPGDRPRPWDGSQLFICGLMVPPDPGLDVAGHSAFTSGTESA